MTYEPGQRCLHNNNKLVQNINFGANFGDNLLMRNMIFLYHGINNQNYSIKYQN